LICLEVLSAIKAEKRDFEKAYNYLFELKSINESIYNESTKKAIADLEVKYQIAKKNRQINELSYINKVQRQNTTIFIISVSGVGLIMLLIILLFSYRNASIKQKYNLLSTKAEVQKKDALLKKKEQQFLKGQLEKRNKDLLSKVLLINKNNENTIKIISILKKLKLSETGNTSKLKTEINNVIRNLEKNADNMLWQDFEIAFKNLHDRFYSELLERCPDLTPTEIKTAALLKLNLTTKEIASITFKSESSIKSIRFRLRKKLSIEGCENLTTFLMKL
jgi:DNA-binding CsgD family transcriptional regulator